MDNLRASIGVLFSDYSPEFALESVLREGLRLDQERLRRLFNNRFPRQTLDQCGLAVDMLREYHFRKPDETTGKEKPHNNEDCRVFNVLLHFTERVLEDKEEKPRIKFEHLLRWNEISTEVGEDLLTTSFLAYKDLKGSFSRTKFDWNISISHNEPNLNELFSRSMADVHMHLKGSSANFDLNWLSLMNFPTNRSEEFGKIRKEWKDGIEKDNEALQSLVIKASAIRYLLFLKYWKGKAEVDYEQLYSLISEKTFVSLKSEAESLAGKLSIEFQELIAVGGNPLGHDYAYPISWESYERNPNLMLSGERGVLYHSFRAIFEGKMTRKDAGLFYIYLLIKNLLRRQLLQFNPNVGFGNFADFEHDKTRFIGKRHKDFIEPLSVTRYMGKGERFVEARITPKSKPGSQKKNIEEIDTKVGKLYRHLSKNIEDSKFEDHFKYVAHFIKKKDGVLPEEGLIHERHHKLREEIRLQALSLNEYRQRGKSVFNSGLHDRIVGIDAANSEFLTRPEVFAQAFRFLGSRKQTQDGEFVGALKKTYHVGEDFLSPIDGLRAIDEAITYCGISRGERLGHCIVLGIVAEKYYEDRHNLLLMPKETVLSNIAWCLNFAPIISSDSLRNYLVTKFERTLREVYGKNNANWRDYYEGWLLRGDNPSRYRFLYSGSGIFDGEEAHPWSRYDLNSHSEVVAARKNEIALRFYYDYHFDAGVRNRGMEIMELEVPEEISEMVKGLQKFMIEKLRKNGIAIETNPTSNYRIGGFEKYSELPVMTFTKPGSESGLNLSVNTDDSGVFATSLEREFSLLGAAMYKEKMRMDEILERLDALRENGLRQKF